MSNVMLNVSDAASHGGNISPAQEEAEAVVVKEQAVPVVDPLEVMADNNADLENDWNASRCLALPRGAKAILQGLAAQEMLHQLLKAPLQWAVTQQCRDLTEDARDDEVLPCVDFDMWKSLVLQCPLACRRKYDFWLTGDELTGDDRSIHVQLFPLSVLVRLEEYPHLCQVNGYGSRSMLLLKLIQTVVEAHPTALMERDTKKGVRPLDVACMYRASVPIVEYLVDQMERDGLSLSRILNNNRFHPLYLTFTCCNYRPPSTDVIEFWLRKAPALCAEQIGGGLHLHLAIESGVPLPTLKKLVHDPNTVLNADSIGQTAIFYACRRNCADSLAVMQWLWDCHFAYLRHDNSNNTSWEVVSADDSNFDSDWVREGRHFLWRPDNHAHSILAEAIFRCFSMEVIEFLISKYQQEHNWWLQEQQEYGAQELEANNRNDPLVAGENGFTLLHFAVLRTCFRDKGDSLPWCRQLLQLLANNFPWMLTAGIGLPDFTPLGCACLGLGTGNEVSTALQITTSSNFKELFKFLVQLEPRALLMGRPQEWPLNLAERQNADASFVEFLSRETRRIQELVQQEEEVNC
mmetsp:Transcript_12425/g.34482  ORF Transcript_12425/g.34482 Transcript_12425/m.34482 type:complete len:577 (-) Transcript_12425:183-1913(-)